MDNGPTDNDDNHVPRYIYYFDYLVLTSIFSNVKLLNKYLNKIEEKLKYDKKKN